MLQILNDLTNPPWQAKKQYNLKNDRIYIALLRITTVSAIWEIKGNTEMHNYSIFSCEPAAFIGCYVFTVSVSVAY